RHLPLAARTAPDRLPSGRRGIPAGPRGETPLGAAGISRRRGAPPMDLSSFLAPVAGAAPSRRAVNAGFHAYARRRLKELDRLDPVAIQERTLRNLVRSAAATRFGRDHGFSEIRSIADFQRRVPIRVYEQLWEDYLKERYPVFEDLTWPGRIPYLALS